MQSNYNKLFEVFFIEMLPCYSTNLVYILLITSLIEGDSFIKLRIL